MTSARATSFATPQDLRGYIKCRDAGGSPAACLSKGDNGEGAWGDETWVLDVAICALPRTVARHNARVRVLLTAGHGEAFECLCRDIAPSGVIDLNPGALTAAGLALDTELSCDAQWEFVS